MRVHQKSEVVGSLCCTQLWQSKRHYGWRAMRCLAVGLSLRRRWEEQHGNISHAQKVEKDGAENSQQSWRKRQSTSRVWDTLLVLVKPEEVIYERSIFRKIYEEKLCDWKVLLARLVLLLLEVCHETWCLVWMPKYHLKYYSLNLHIWGTIQIRNEVCFW